MSFSGFNLGRVHEVIASQVPDTECIVWRDRRMTYAEVTDRTRRLATFLHSQGLGCRKERAELANHEAGQDLLGIYLYNGNEYLETMLGCYKARVAPFNVNYRYVEEELHYLLSDAQASALVYHARFAPVLKAVLPRLSHVRVLVQVQDESGNDLLPGAVDYEEAIQSSDARLPVEESPDDLYVLYTGGTTGMPKGVLWRQHDIFMSAMGGRMIGSWEPLADYDALVARLVRPGVRMMILPPLMHGAAQWASSIGMSLGGTCIFPESVERLVPTDVWATAEREGAQSMSVVGDAMARPLIEELERGDYDLSSMFTVGNGGALLSPALKNRLLAALPNIFISDAVGASETGAQAGHVSAKGSVATGRFTPGPGALVVDETMSKVLEPGHEGLGWLAQAGWVPLGYLGDPAKTARTFPVIDGVRYAIPGDRARHLDDGSIELLGRDAVTINTGGEKVFAEEVEQAIVDHPDVRDVVVVGRDSERWGKEVVALVALADGSTTTEKDLAEHASARIARYKLPKAWIFLPTIQRSPSGKADYRWAAETARAAAPQF